MSLTLQQRSAVECDQNILLTACPGSGKTRTIIAKLVREVERYRDTPRAVACITYTNTAVQEIEHRSAALLRSGDELNYVVSTIHAFCLNYILRPFAWRLEGFAGMPRILSRDNPDFEIIAQHAAAQVGFYNLRPSDYEAFEGLNINTAGQIIGSAERNDIVRRAAPHFWRRCEELGYIDFCNVLYRSYLLLRDHPDVTRSLGSRFAFFLIDEFQDTTDLQIEILKLIHAQRKSAFFAVGDLAQSIYAFTGARPELVQPFADHIGARSDMSLSGNYRSNPQIIAHAEGLFPRNPAMVAAGQNSACTQQPRLVTGVSSFQAITEHFLPVLADMNIPLGEASILSKMWTTLLPLSRQLREFGVPVVGPGARPYRRVRLFATLAEQICGAIIDPQPESVYTLERALFNAVQDATGQSRTDVFSFKGRVAIIRMLREAKRLADTGAGGAIAWLDAMAMATGDTLRQAEFVDAAQAGLFYASVQEMKADMQRNGTDMENLSIEDLGMFASPSRALRLSTIHNSKGREYSAVAILGVREGSIPDYRARTASEIESEKRLFYVAVTRAKRFLLYVCESDRFGNPPSRFLGAEGVNILGSTMAFAA